MQIFCKVFGFAKLIGYLASAVNVVPSNLCVGPSPRIKISSFSLSISRDELISAPKIMKFFPMLPCVTEKSERESTPMQ